MDNLRLGDFFPCYMYTWVLPMCGNTIRFYMLILYSATLLLCLINTQSLSENLDGFFFMLSVLQMRIFLLNLYFKNFLEFPDCPMVRTPRFHC